MAGFLTRCQQTLAAIPSMASAERLLTKAALVVDPEHKGSPAVALAKAACGVGWVAAQCLSGIYNKHHSGNHVPPWPPHPKNLLFAKTLSSFEREALEQFSSLGFIPNLKGLCVSASHLGKAQAWYAGSVGPEQYLSDYTKTLESLKRLDPSKEAVEKWRAIYRGWIWDYARSHHLDVFYDGFEFDQGGNPMWAKPEDHVVYAVANHASLFPDFLLPWVDDKVAYAADAWNFRDNPFSLLGGFGFMGDLIAQPVVDRQDVRRNAVLIKTILKSSRDHGVRTATYFQGTRAFKAHNDDGSQGPAGFFGSIPDTKNLLRYMVMEGVVLSALQLASVTKTEVKLGLVTLQGTEFVMPNEGSRVGPPYVQRNLAGLTIRHCLEGILEVPVTTQGDSRKKVAQELQDQALKIFRESLGIDTYLQGTVEIWGNGFSNSGQVLLESGGKDVRWFIITDRLRCIPPSDPARNIFEKKLLSLLHCSSTISEDIDTLLRDVSRQVLRINKPEVYV